MTTENGGDSSSHNLRIDSMKTIRELRLVVRKQEIYVSQLERYKEMRDRLLTRLNDTLKRTSLDTSTNDETAAEDFLCGLHEMQEEISADNGVRSGRLEFKNVDENEILTGKRKHSPERASPRLFFGDAVEAQVYASTEHALWGKGEGLSLLASAPPGTSQGDGQGKEEGIKKQKKLKDRKGRQGIAKIGSSSSESMEILKRMKERDNKHREDLFKGLERVIEENPNAFSKVSGTISEKPPWLVGFAEADVVHSANIGGQRMNSVEDYLDDFEDE